MRIQCLIERPARMPGKPYVGTKLHLDGTEYFFQPSKDDPRHLCEVENKQHIKLLLAIKEGYRDADAPKQDPKEAVKLDGDDDDDDGFNKTSETEIQVGEEIVDLAKLSLADLVTTMRKLNIPDIAGHKSKAKLIDHILQTLEDRAAAGQ